MGDDRLTAPSRALLEGPARAPARFYLRNIGYTERQLRQPIIGVSHSWTDTPGSPFVFSATPARLHRGVPDLGQHTAEVLGPDGDEEGAR